MKTTLIGIAVIATFSILSIPAHADCAYPLSKNQKHIQITSPQHFADHEGIVGTWLVNYGAVGDAFIQWHSDGTEWENITHPVLGGNICMGSWVATGPWTYSRNHYGWLFDPTGTMNIGWFNETETDTLSRDGNSYHGTNTTHFFATGSTLPPTGFPVSVEGTSDAVRLAP